MAMPPSKPDDCAEPHMDDEADDEIEEQHLGFRIGAERR